MSKKVVAIVTRERSGSTVLQRFLATHPGFSLLGEMWNMGTASSAFYEFWHAKILKDAKNLRLNNLNGLFNEFLDNRLAKAPSGAILDIKYASLDNLRYFWGPKFNDKGIAVLSEPTLLKNLKQRDAHVIHLVRRNKVAIYVSLLRARETGIWRVSRNADLPQTEASSLLDVDVGALTKFVVHERRMDALVASYLQKYEKHRSLVYEDVLPEDTARLSEATVSSIADFLQEDASKFDPVLPHRKAVQGALATHLQRPEKIREALKSIDADWMLNDEA